MKTDLTAAARLQLRSELFASVFLLVQNLTRLGDAAIEAESITTKQWLLLAVLMRRFPGEEPTLSEVAQAYGSSRQNVKQIALLLQRRGYLRLVADPSDRRAVRLRVLGKVAVFDQPAQRQRQAAFFDTVFAGMTPAELRELHRLVGRWLALIPPT